MNTLQTFNFSNQSVRVVLKNGEPWWIAADVCKILTIQNGADAVSRLDPDEKSTIEISDSGNLNSIRIIVSESGLYTLIMRSNKPEARTFRKWVTSEVLPQIRKTGAYTAIPSDPVEQVLLLANKLSETAKLVLEERSKNLALTHQINEQAPMVDMATAFLSSTNSITITEFAKAIGVSGVSLFYWLDENGFIWKNDHQKAIQKYVDLRWFEHKEVPRWNDKEKFDLQIRITPLGQSEIFKAINKAGGIEIVKETYSHHLTHKRRVRV